MSVLYKGKETIDLLTDLRKKIELATIETEAAGEVLRSVERGVGSDVEVEIIKLIDALAELEVNSKYLWELSVRVSDEIF